MHNLPVRIKLFQEKCSFNISGAFATASILHSSLPLNQTFLWHPIPGAMLRFASLKRLNFNFLGFI